MHETLIDHIKSIDLPILIILDTSTDIVIKNMLLVQIRIVQNGAPKVFFYRLIELKAENAERLFQELFVTFEKDGITNEITERLYGFIADSACVMLGSNTGLATRIKHEVTPDVHGSQTPISTVWSI